MSVDSVVDPSPAAYSSAVSLGAILRLPTHPDTVDLPGLGASVGWTDAACGRPCPGPRAARVACAVRCGGPDLGARGFPASLWRRAPRWPLRPKVCCSCWLMPSARICASKVAGSSSMRRSRLVPISPFLRRRCSATARPDLAFLQRALRPFPGPPARPGARSAGGVSALPSGCRPAGRWPVGPPSPASCAASSGCSCAHGSPRALGEPSPRSGPGFQRVVVIVHRAAAVPFRRAGARCGRESVVAPGGFVELRSHCCAHVASGPLFLTVVAPFPVEAHDLPRVG